REVALKVLPEEFAKDPERMARFEREAKVLASLNHPNIATLYGLETVESDEDAGAGTGKTTFLAMELVEGEDLSERIKKGPVPIEEATAIALQIAEALEAAHEQGIVHRDLKPANIKLRPDGTVKVLDFGLAKAWEADAPDSALSLSPTRTAHATAAGLILGTAAYMSPEQARGMSVDRRADIWSFGVVLWEMLSGRKLFEGHTVSDVLASVLKESPDLEVLPSQTPPHVKRLIRRCLDKEPRSRLRDIGEARIALVQPDEDLPPSDALVGPTEQGPRRRLPWVAAGIAAVAALILGALLIGRKGPEQPVIRFETPPSPGGRFHLAPDNPGPVRVSPDGTMLVYSGRTDDGLIRLWVRALDEVAARPLPGTEGAQYPFWSPDSKRIGFFASGKLRVVDAVGGPPLALCDAGEGKGGTWSTNGTIVFAPSYNSPLHRVSDAGGESTPVTEFVAERKDNSHRHPRFLPDGNHFLYMARSAMGTSEGQAVMIGALDGSVSVQLFRAPAAVEYASGHILFVRERTLMARAFDADKLEFTGDAFPIVEKVTLLQPGTVIGVYSASQNGVLAYQSGEGETGSYRLVWRDREGNEVGTVGEPRGYDEVHLIPGGELAAVALEETSAGSGDIWVIDLRRDLFTRFTFEPGYEFGVTPTADGKALIYSAQRDGVWVLMRKDIGGAGEGEVIFESDTEMYPSSVSPDGKYLCLYKGGDTTGYDLWMLPLSGQGEGAAFIDSDFNEFMVMFSPDGRWLAYVSDESGSPQVYVTAFPERGRK
ncbi:MAG: protein kinase, partial [Acidobacteriota bacterium]